MRAARFEVTRRRRALAHVRGGDDDDLARQAADDALVAVFAKLSEFRGDSRFTTWAYKFALYEAAVKLRRRAWQDRELPLEPEHWPQLACSGVSPDHRHLIAALLGPAGPELSCEECFDQLDRYVDLQLTAADADRAVPGMRAHLTGCPACHDDHASVHELVATEDRLRAPSAGS